MATKETKASKDKGNDPGHFSVRLKPESVKLLEEKLAGTRLSRNALVQLLIDDQLPTWNPLEALGRLAAKGA